MKNQKLWIVGRYEGTNKNDISCWTFEGIYSKESDAIRRATLTNHFVAPVVVDEKIPEEDFDWPGLYYPNYHHLKD